MSEPTSKEEFERRFRGHTRMSGQGAEVQVHMPCPFCGARDWAVYRLLEMPARLARPTECKACGRSAALLTDWGASSASGRFVQTGGPDAPPWSALPRLSLDVDRAGVLVERVTPARHGRP